MPWVDISEAAFTLGVSERTIRSWIKSGKLNARNFNGRREVEIPDPDENVGGRAFVDDDDEGNSLETQKRLEVALIECGRVKGTLASQERMMENLSSNIQELNAKLQRSERVIAKRTLYCVVVAFLGLIAYLVTRTTFQGDMLKMSDDYRTETQNLKASHTQDMQSLDKLHKDELLSELKKKDEISAKLLLEKEKMLDGKYGKEKADLTAKFEKEIAKLEQKVEKLRSDMDAMREANMKLSVERDSLRKDVRGTEEKLATSEHELEQQRKLLQEAEKSRAELERELARWKGHYKTPPPN